MSKDIVAHSISLMSDEDVVTVLQILYKRNDKYNKFTCLRESVILNKYIYYVRMILSIWMCKFYQQIRSYRGTTRITDSKQLKDWHANPLYAISMSEILPYGGL